MANVRETVFLPQPATGVSGGVVAAPFQLMFTGEDHLRLEGWNSVSGVTLSLQGRWLNHEGNIDEFGATLALTSDRARAVRDIPLTQGFLLNAVIVATGGAPRVGQTFARLSLIRGFTGATVVLGTLLQGYVTAQHGLGWPGSPIQHSLEGGGAVRVVLGTQPAAGASFIVPVPAGARWDVLAVNCALVCSATVATRQPGVILLQPGGGGMMSWSPGTATATQTITFMWERGMPLETAILPNFVVAGLPTDMPLLEGGDVRDLTINMQAGDRWSAPTVIVREWLEIA